MGEEVGEQGRTRGGASKEIAAKCITIRNTVL